MQVKQLSGRGGPRIRGLLHPGLAEPSGGATSCGFALRNTCWDLIKQDSHGAPWQQVTQLI